MISQVGDKNEQLRHARAERLRRLRKMTRLSRKMYSERYQISSGTLQNWETARFGGLTEKGAHFMIETLAKEGIHCQFEWLMYGAGNGPLLTKTAQDLAKTHAPTKKRKQPKSFPEALSTELGKFYQLHPNATHMSIIDDSMHPHYAKNDVVAGLKVTGDGIAQLCHNCCIIDTEEYGRLVRLMLKGTEPDHYHLLCLNQYTQEAHYVLPNVKIIEAASIIWMRREDA